MKKYLIVLLSLVGTSAHVQAQPPCSPVVVIDSDISSNTTLSAANLYRIQGCVSVLTGSTLTIPAGTVITFANNDNLMIEPGAYIQALGTPAAPVEFTSTAAPGSRVPLSNAGLIIRGNAAINESSLALPCSLTHTSGSTAADSSGVLTYVRFSYLSGSAGVLYLDNALSLVGVGNKTKIENIQVSYSANNGLGIVGGEQSIKEVLVLDSKKSDVYIGLGAQSQIQSLLTLKKDTSMHDVAGTYGMLIENNRSTPGATPYTHPVISNASIIGPWQCDPSTVSIDYRDGILMRNNARAELYNVVAAFHNRYGLYIEDAPTAQNTANDALNVAYSSFTDNASGNYNHGAFSWSGNGCSSSMADWIAGLTAVGCEETGNQFSPIDLAYDASFCGDFCSPNFVQDFVLDGSNTGLDVPDYTAPVLASFQALDYRGGIQEADLYAPWAELCPQNKIICTQQALRSIAQPATLMLYPNPARAFTEVQFDSEQAGLATITILDKVSGKVLMEKRVAIQNAGHQKILLSTKGLSENVYTVRVVLKDKVLYGQLVVK